MTPTHLRALSAGVCVSAALAASLSLATSRLLAQGTTRPWTFVVSGDARNCGDVVAPGIAATARTVNASFYWHLGDLRWTSDIDQDMARTPERLKAPLSVSAYLNTEWPDFIENQIGAFGSTPYFIGLGNHELIAPKLRDEYLIQFADWLNTPVLRAQRLKDDPKDHKLRAYYRWIDRGVSFYTLDNASNDMFDAAQLRWFERALASDSADPAITTIVVGMHKPLPDGYNEDHSMNESGTSTDTGRRVYADLLKARDAAHKKVFVLASHQHFYMPNAYDTKYWREHGGVLPGWVVGTAGATRYELPKPSPDGSLTNVYGSLVGTVQPGGDITFAFARVDEPDLPASVGTKFGTELVHWCFASNTNVK